MGNEGPGSLPGPARFPLFQRGLRWLPLVAIASGLAGWGFYILVSGTAST